MKRNRIIVAVVAIMLLLGVQRTPEAQVGEVFTLIGGVVATGIVVGGCAHMVATQNPDMTPITTEPPATE
jgi:ethanolamine transporter EutH